MGFKTIFIIVVSVLVTIILMNNTDEINFWIFGDVRIPKLVILGVMFGLGLIVGFMAGRSRLAVVTPTTDMEQRHKEVHNDKRDQLSEEDRNYIE